MKTNGKIQTLETVRLGEILFCCCNINLSKEWHVTLDYFPINFRLVHKLKFHDIGVNIEGVILRNTKTTFCQDLEPS